MNVACTPKLINNLLNLIQYLSMRSFLQILENLILLLESYMNHKAFCLEDNKDLLFPSYLEGEIKIIPNLVLL